MNEKIQSGPVAANTRTKSKFVFLVVAVGAVFIIGVIVPFRTGGQSEKDVFVREFPTAQFFHLTSEDQARPEKGSRYDKRRNLVSDDPPQSDGGTVRFYDETPARKQLPIDVSDLIVVGKVVDWTLGAGRIRATGVGGEPGCVKFWQLVLPILAIRENVGVIDPVLGAIECGCFSHTDVHLVTAGGEVGLVHHGGADGTGPVDRRCLIGTVEEA